VVSERSTEASTWRCTFVGGSAGANGQVWGVRVMDPTKLHPQGYVSYFNNGYQAVNPLTGQTISRDNPLWHIDLSPWIWP